VNTVALGTGTILEVPTTTTLATTATARSGLIETNYTTATTESQDIPQQPQQQPEVSKKISLSTELQEKHDINPNPNQKKSSRNKKSTQQSSQQKPEEEEKEEEEEPNPNKNNDDEKNTNIDIHTVDCEKQILTRNQSEANDPNNGLPDLLYRLTTTKPQFYISLHKQIFDRLRWNSIMQHGEYYEKGLTKVFKSILNKKPAGRIIDIGMNIGWFALYSKAINPTQFKVAAFEPNPIMHARVCESIRLNSQWNTTTTTTTPGIEIYPYGLSNTTDVLTLTTGKNPGMSSFDPERLAKKFRKSIQVPVVTLDSVAKHQNWIASNEPVHLMKVDVEGHEPYVLKGATELLQSRLIANIIMENGCTDTRLVVELLLQLSNAGYGLHMILNTNGDKNKLINTTKMQQSIDELTSTVDTIFNVTEILNNEDVQYFVTETFNSWWTLKQANNLVKK
jgi:FkbM family methyltransferase